MFIIYIMLGAPFFSLPHHSARTMVDICNFCSKSTLSFNPYFGAGLKYLAQLNHYHHQKDKRYFLQ